MAGARVQLDRSRVHRSVAMAPRANQATPQAAAIASSPVRAPRELRCPGDGWRTLRHANGSGSLSDPRAVLAKISGPPSDPGAPGKSGMVLPLFCVGQIFLPPKMCPLRGTHTSINLPRIGGNLDQPDVNGRRPDSIEACPSWRPESEGPEAG